MQIFNFCIRPQLKREWIFTQRVTPVLAGKDIVVTDAAVKYKYPLTVEAYTLAERAALRQFLLNHSERQSFLIQFTGDADYTAVELVEAPNEVDVNIQAFVEIVVKTTGETPDTSPPLPATAINFALASNGSTATATSALSTLVAAKTIDGVVHASSKWHSNTNQPAITAANPQILTVLFGQTRSVKQVDVFFDETTADTNLTETGYYTTQDYKIELLVNGVWTQKASGAGNQYKHVRHPVTDASATGVRIKNEACQYGYAIIAEIQAWG